MIVYLHLNFQEGMGNGERVWGIGHRALVIPPCSLLPCLPCPPCPPCPPCLPSLVPFPQSPLSSIPKNQNNYRPEIFSFLQLLAVCLFLLPLLRLWQRDQYKDEKIAKSMVITNHVMLQNTTNKYHKL